MKSLSSLLSGIEILEIIGNKTSQINSIHFDSRSVQKQSIFAAYKGDSHDGHDFIEDAIGRGAAVIIHEREILEKHLAITFVRVSDSRIALASIAQNFYNHPSKKLKLVGVTGTNGKTTTVTMLFKLFKELGYSSALISTIENRINDEVFKTINTTPDPITLASFLDQAVRKGCTHAFMECSSHAIDQERIWGLEFAFAIFTNLTHDHLDYHKTIEIYAQAKKELFDTLSGDSFALANCDDIWGEYILSQTRAKKYFFSLKDKKLKQSINGLTISWDGKTIKSRLIGTFNAYNIIGIYTAGILLGAPEEKIISAIALIDPPAGRLEFIWSKDKVCGIIDYAHTPDALLNVLETIKEIMPKGGKIITVVGCSGERDRTKRPLMGKIAYEKSDYTVFTSDNPKSENPKMILEEIVKGLPKNTNKYECEPDRVKAINIACSHISSGDTILLAGKGHEDCQILDTGKIPFSDKEELQKHFKNRAIPKKVLK